MMIVIVRDRGSLTSRILHLTGWYFVVSCLSLRSIEGDEALIENRAKWCARLLKICCVRAQRGESKHEVDSGRSHWTVIQ